MKNLELGTTVMTRGVSALCGGQPELLSQFMRRYQNADWGDLCSEDKEVNDKALEHGGRILAKYHFNNKPIYIITEADRSATTVLLPSEY
ncbi:type I restriction endonuclease subunit M [Photobacterium makurazakiensis]|uniref:type I restriction endonuclease subunit M n=1 Tax=Photobacterium makurazakiensis TaxID=2910234 RepID=UPI003D107D4D